MTQTATKQADIRFRVELKNKPWIVIYKVRSSDDTRDYNVTVIRGKVNNCDCDSRKPCYHMRDVQAREDERHNFSACGGCGHLKHGVIADYLCDQCRAERKSERLSREAYVQEFQVYGE